MICRKKRCSLPALLLFALLCLCSCAIFTNAPSTCGPSSSVPPGPAITKSHGTYFVDVTDEYAVDNAQYSYKEASQTSTFIFFGMRTIPELTENNMGIIIWAPAENKLELYFEIFVSTGTGSPAGPNIRYAVNMESNEILTKSIEDYAGTLQPEKSGTFPAIADSRLLEIAQTFKNTIDELEVKYLPQFAEFTA